MKKLFKNERIMKNFKLIEELLKSERAIKE